MPVSDVCASFGLLSFRCLGQFRILAPVSDSSVSDSCVSFGFLVSDSCLSFGSLSFGLFRQFRIRAFTVSVGGFSRERRFRVQFRVLALGVKFGLGFRV